jgi:ADP-ribose pyrophosphatase YjhB (NUDIX family)
LLCRRGIEPRVGKWGFPQGFMELGESTRDGAARETAEEAGATVVPGPLLAVYNLPGQVQLLYLARVVANDETRRKPSSGGGGSMDLDLDPPPVRCGIETLETEFFKWDELPEEEELAFPTVAWALDFAKNVADEKWRANEPFVPQQRTKLFFGAPADGDVGFMDEA